MASLPELETRDEVQKYLQGLAEELGVSLESSELAGELDRRDQLAHLRQKFSMPIIGKMLDGADIEKGNGCSAADIGASVGFSAPICIIV